MPGPVPRSVEVPWKDLLTKRTLLHEHLRSFRGVEDFVARMTSSRLSDRRDAAALERFAEEVFNIYVDLGRDLLARTVSADRSLVREIPTGAVLVHLRVAGVIARTTYDDLDAIRESRNSWQHGASFVPAAAVWRGILQTDRTIDKALAALQRGFDRVGLRLDLEFPELDAPPGVSGPSPAGRS
jgi:hypothetical protein